MSESRKLIGRERTVHHSETSRAYGRCVVCGRQDPCRIHEYCDRFVIFGRSVVTYNSGANRYCRYCADEPVIEIIELPELPERSWTPDGLRDLASSGAPTLYHVDFHEVDREGLWELINYIRSSTESTPATISADQIERIEAGSSAILTEASLEALRWWTVKALKDDDSAEQDRSRYYDILCDSDDATEVDTMDVLHEQAYEEYHDPLRKMVKEGEN